MATRKVLTVRLEFNFSDRKIHGARLKSAYDAAVAAAIEAAQGELLEDSVESVNHYVSFDYRWVESSGTALGASLEDWSEEEAEE